MARKTSEAQVYLQFQDDLLIFGNEKLLLGVEIGDHLNPCVIADNANRRYVADGNYTYSLSLDGKHKAEKLLFENFSVSKLPGGAVELTFFGRPAFRGKNPPHDILVFHSFTSSPGKLWLDERISIMNTGPNSYKVDDLRFGFRKSLFKNKVSKGFGGMKLYSLPFQRFWGQRIDRGEDSYTVKDLVEKRGDLPGYASEGWMLNNGKNGFLIVKHSPDLIEFSCLERRKSRGAVELIHGGVGMYKGDPEQAAILEPWSEKDFGTTRYIVFDGGFEDGCYAFRDYMISLGHTAPKDYKPRIFWNVLYNLECSLTVADTKPYSKRQLEKEAALAQRMGCEALYLDPQWDTVMGSTVWDTKRLGRMKTFVQTIREKHGLELALHLMMNTDNETEYEGMYRTSRSGKINKWANRLAMICSPSEWKELKKKRVAKLCSDGARWVMFDFTDLDPGTECWNEEHPHHIPSRRCEHADGIYEVIRHVKSSYPEVTIESHDRVTSGANDHHQMYYQHTGTDRHDEGWAFEMMWDSMNDLMTGKAFSLYSYRMCCDIPQYLHFNLSNDNDNLLCFWWFASTVRHIGVGGLDDPESPRFKKSLAEMKTYRRLRRFFTHGTFRGIDPTCHVHVLEDKNRAVINAFNLTEKAAKMTRTVDLDKLGLDSGRISSIKGADFKWKGSLLTFTLAIPPLSPALIEIK